jgi:hypothetical protein
MSRPTLALRIESRGPSAWSPSAPELAIATPSGLTIADLSSGERSELVLPETGCVEWAPDGSAIAIAAGEVVSVADPRGSVRWRLEGARGAVDSLTWSPDGRSLACLDDDVFVCDAQSGGLRWRHERRSDRSRWIDRSSTAVVELGADVESPDGLVWSPDSALVRVRYRSVSLVLRALDGALLEERARTDDEPMAWDAADEPPLIRRARLAKRTLDVPGEVWGRACFSSDGRSAVAEATWPHLHVCRGDDYAAVHRGPANTDAYAWSPRGELAVACDDRVIRRLAVGALELTEWLRLDARPRALAFSSCGAWLAVHTDHEVIVFADV